jgi:hypothetical protein
MVGDEPMFEACASVRAVHAARPPRQAIRALSGTFDLDARRDAEVFEIYLF